MLTENHVAQFHALGYMIIRQCLSSTELQSLEGAFNRVIEMSPEHNDFGEGFGFRYSPCSRCVIPFVYEDPTFFNLVEHPILMQSMIKIFGNICLYAAGSDMWLNVDDSPWHTDGMPGREIQSLKAAIYLDATDGENGAIWVIPGSHHPDFSRSLFKHCGYWDEHRPRLKLDRYGIDGAISLDTDPGDVILFDNRIWHAAFRRNDGKARRTMYIGYVPDPGDDIIGIHFLQNMVASTLTAKYPHVYSEDMVLQSDVWRKQMISRLIQLGVKNVQPRGLVPQKDSEVS